MMTPLFIGGLGMQEVLLIALVVLLSSLSLVVLPMWLPCEVSIGIARNK